MNVSILSDFNIVEFNYYLFMVNLSKWNRSWNVVDDLKTEMCVFSKVFKLIKAINKAKNLIKHIFFDFKCKFNSTTFNWNQKWNNGKRAKKVINGISVQVFMGTICI